jgi:histidinol-phosphatase (PHP family)
VLDYHLHLWDHGQAPAGVTIDRIAAYWRRAEAQGVTEIAVTEHVFRFQQVVGVLEGFWEDDPQRELHPSMAAWWSGEGRVDLDRYVDVALQARASGLPVVVGLEVDHYPGRMEALAELLDQYPFDVLLGSVHWLGAWAFDEPEVAPFANEWVRRGAERAWTDYAGAIEELAATGAVDVLAHPDYMKTCGPMPLAPDEFYRRIAEAAAASGLAAEVSSAAWAEVDEPYPAPALLTRFRECGVPVTTASDAHDEPDVATRANDLAEIVRRAGYDELAAYRDRRRCAVEIAPSTASRGGTASTAR